MDGPMVINVAPEGTFPRSHSPASRPPGTPPVPAIKVPDVAGRINWMLGSSSETAMMPAITLFIEVRLTLRLSKMNSLPGDQRDSARPASIAKDGAMGSKY